MHDPEAPEVRRGEVGLGSGQEPHGVEGRYGQSREEEEPGHVRNVLVAEPASHPPEEYGHPEKEPHREQNLPEAPQVEVLKALVAEPGPRVAHAAEDAEPLPDEAPEHDDRQSPEQREGEPALPSRLSSGDHGHEEDAGGEERGRHPEDGELHVPGAHEVVRQPLRQIEAEEARQIRPVVLRGRPHERLHEEQRCHDEEEPGASPLRGRQRHVPRRPERERRLFAPVPAEEVPPPEGGEEQPDAAEKRDQGEYAPHHDVGRRLVLHETLWRPVGGVGVVEARPERRSGPRRPCEVRGELPYLLVVRDRLGPQPEPGARLAEVPPVVSRELLVGRRLRRRELEGARLGVVAVLLEVLHRARRGRVRLLTPIALAYGESRAAQVVRGEVRAQVCAMAKDRTVLHEAVPEEYPLTGLDVLAREDELALRVHDPLRDRGLPGVRPVGEKPEHEKAEEDHQHNSLNPASRNQQLTPPRSLLHQTPPENPVGAAPPPNYHQFGNMVWASLPCKDRRLSSSGAPSCVQGYDQLLEARPSWGGLTWSEEHRVLREVTSCYGT